MDGMGCDLCVGLFYEHRFAMLISGRRTWQNMAEHYFPEGKFKEAAPPLTDDLEPRKLLPKDLMGKVYIKYTCHFQVRKVKFLVGP